MRPLAALTLVASLTACYNPDVATGLVCGEDGECPEPQFCGADNLCRFDDDDDDIDAAVGTPDAPGAPDAFGLPSCEQPIPCPGADSDKVTICGQLVDFSDDSPIRDDGTGTACEPTMTAGPCGLEMRFYEPLALSPETTPLDVDEILIDDCGRYRAVDIDAPSGGAIVIVVDDVATAADPDHVRTGLSVSVVAGERIPLLDAYVLEDDDDADWTSLAGNPFGAQTFSEVGTIVAIYRHQGIPVQGVTAQIDGGAVPANDFYFSDADPAQRVLVDPSLAATDKNGSAALVNVILNNVSGMGAEPAGCSWNSVNMEAIPGMVIVRFIDAIANGAPGTPCP